VEPETMNKGEIIIYQTLDGINLDVRLKGELEKYSTVKECLTVQQEGPRSVQRNVNYFIK
jgi:hypothetical protein